MTHYIEYANWQSHIDFCADAEVIPFGCFAGRCIDWACELNWEQRAVAYQVAEERYLQRIEDDAIEAACGSDERRNEDRWPEGSYV